MSEPVCSVILVNWNHGHLLPACLDALLAQEGVAFDVTVVDNGSQDGSPAWLPRRYPAVRLWEFADNRGFCRALNHGTRHSQAEWILSLNPDVVVRPGFLWALIEAGAREPRVGMVAPKLLCAADPGRLDSTGLFIDRRRRPFDRGQGEADQGQYDALPYTFGACGAAGLYRRAMLDDVAPDGEYLDEAFFAYYEDADLAWRAQARGWRCTYAPAAVATHARGGGDTLRKAGREAKGARGPRLALRNRYLMTIKNDRWADLATDLARILAAEMPRLAYAAVTRPSILLGLADLAWAAPAAWRKRRAGQGRRTVAAAAVRCWFTAPDRMAAGG